jgi:hypothetical protein
MSQPTEWYRTGEARIVPSWFGFMRAEVMERRDFPGYSGTMEDGSFQVRWVSAGRLPVEFDNAGPFGFWSTMATPPDDPSYGDRSLWRNFISCFPRPKSRTKLSTHSRQDTE